MSAAEDSLFADDASPALMAVRSSDLLEHVGLTPYYQDELVKIFHADTLNALAAMTGNVAAVVTDPPYASGARTEAQKSSSGAMMRGQRWASKPIENTASPSASAPCSETTCEKCERIQYHGPCPHDSKLTSRKQLTAEEAATQIRKQYGARLAVLAD